jgi:uncharacterized protein (DUF1697 family)
MQQIVLLRGINVGARNRIAMPALRELLLGAGLEDVRSYLQSGNMVVSSDAPSEELADRCERQIAERFGLEIAVVTRTHKELAKVVARDPLGEVADNPKRYQVSFLSAEPDAEALRGVADLATASEQFVAIGRELYAWHPEGVARSRLSAALAGPKLGVTATARNWTTVTKLLAIAGT